MASASATSAVRLGVSVCRHHPRPQSTPLRIQLLSRSTPVSRRAFSTTNARRVDEPPKTESQPAADKKQPAGADSKQQAAETTGGKPADTTTEYAESSPMATMRLDSDGMFMTAESAMDNLLKKKNMRSLDAWVDKVNATKFPPAHKRQFAKEADEIIEPRQDPKSFFFDETDPDQDSQDFDEFEEDDMTEMAHAKLHEVQEMRHYQRLAIWELPLLSSTLHTLSGRSAFQD